jgi:hypothetical protein
VSGPVSIISLINISILFLSTIQTPFPALCPYLLCAVSGHLSLFPSSTFHHLHQDHSDSIPSPLSIPALCCVWTSVMSVINSLTDIPSFASALFTLHFTQPSVHA